MIEEIIDPQEVQKAPEDWRLIGAEVSEQLDYEPGRFLRRRLVRRKYVRRTDQEAPPVIAGVAAESAGALPRGTRTSGADHRQQGRRSPSALSAGNHFWKPSRGSSAAAEYGPPPPDWLRPIYEQIRTGVMAGGYLQIDETPIRYLSPGHGQTKLGYFWTTLSPGGRCGLSLGDQAAGPAASRT